MTEENPSLKKLDTLEALLKKKYGDNYYGIKGDNKVPPIHWTSSGVYALDYVFGKGIPQGKIIQIMGWESCGKSTLVASIAAKYQALGKTVFWIEAGETSLDRDFCQCLGLDVDKMGILSADNAEIAMDAVREILRSGVVDLVCLDSIGGLSNQKEMEDSLADANMALLARLLSKALKQFTTILERNKCTLIVINQFRSKPGVMYGDPTTASGGNALKFFSHIIAKVSKIKPIEVNKKAKGIISKIKVTKNKCAPPFREKEIHIMFPYNDNGTMIAGVDILQDLVPEAIAQGVINQRGSMYTWRDTTIKSKDKVIEHFKANPPLLELLREDLLNHNDNTTTEETYISEEDDESEFTED